MQNKLERIIKVIYKRYKAMAHKVFLQHPDEETIACYFEGCLSDKETEFVKKHLLECDSCAEAFAAAIGLEIHGDLDVPNSLLSDIKNLVLEENIPVLEIFIRLKEKIIELLDTNADVLVNQEWVPASLLRSRKIKSFKDEITILRDYDDIRLEIKIGNKGNNRFDLFVSIKEKPVSRPIKDLRVSLLKGDIELESYVTSSGKAGFEGITPGKYRIEVSGTEGKIILFSIDVTI